MVQVLSTWAAFLCVHIEISPWPQELPAAPALLFWDLDSENGLQPPPIQPSHALFLCSSAPQAAISSYSLHPTSFLCKPVSLSALQRALDLCTDLWWAVWTGWRSPAAGTASPFRCATWCGRREPAGAVSSTALRSASQMGRRWPCWKNGCPGGCFSAPIAAFWSISTTSAVWTARACICPTEL